MLPVRAVVRTQAVLRARAWLPARVLAPPVLWASPVVRARPVLRAVRQAVPRRVATAPASAAAARGWGASATNSSTSSPEIRVVAAAPLVLLDPLVACLREPFLRHHAMGLTVPGRDAAGKCRQ